MSSKLAAWVMDTHGVADVNCVAWAPPVSKIAGIDPSMDLLASAGDDGAIHIWSL